MPGLSYLLDPSLQAAMRSRFMADTQQQPPYSESIPREFRQQEPDVEPDLIDEEGNRRFLDPYYDARSPMASPFQDAPDIFPRHFPLQTESGRILEAGHDYQDYLNWRRNAGELPQNIPGVPDVRPLELNPYIMQLAPESAAGIPGPMLHRGVPGITPSPPGSTVII